MGVLPEPHTYEENGIITSIEYGVNDQGKKIKITRKMERVLVKEQVLKSVAERKVFLEIF